MFDAEALTAKLGPLPAWGWGVGIGVGYLGVRWYRNRASSATDTTTQNPGLQDAGFSASGPGGYYDPSLVNGQGVGFDPSTGIYTPGSGSNCPPGWIELDGVCQPLSTIQGGQGATGATGATGAQGPRGCDAGYHYDAKKKKCVRTKHKHTHHSHRCRKGYHWDTARKKCVRSHSLSSTSSRDNLARNAATPGARATGAAPAAPARATHPLAAPTRVPVRGPHAGPAGQNRYQHASSGVHPR